MKTPREKAEYWLNDNVAGWGELQFESLTMLLKEQDRDTRHACAEAINGIHAAHSGDDDLIERGVSSAACMNVKAV